VKGELLSPCGLTSDERASEFALPRSRSRWRTSLSFSLSPSGAVNAESISLLRLKTQKFDESPHPPLISSANKAHASKRPLKRFILE